MEGEDKMNWLEKIAVNSGYCNMQLHPVSRVNWEQREKEINLKQSMLRSRAESEASKNGHTIGKWNNINSARCITCGKSVFIVGNILSKSADVGGSAMYHGCSDWEYESPYETVKSGCSG